MTYPPQGGSEQGEPAGPYGQPGQYAPPQYGQPGQYAPPQYGQPGQYAPPQYGQPPYGQAGFGPPYGAPPKKSRTGLVIGLVVLAVVVAAAILIPLLLSSTVLDKGAVERDVADQFRQREGVGISLSCGDDMKVENGSTYPCRGTTDDGEGVTLTITITDQDADPPTYTWSEAA